jgi:hypothetical protein
MIVVDEIKEGFKIMLHPVQATKNARGIKDSLKFYYKLSILPWVLYVIFFTISLASVGAASALILGIFSAILIFWVFIPVSFFISALIYHAFGKLFRVFKNGYASTFNATVYGTVPSILFMWLAAIYLLGVLSIVFAFWSLVVLIIALSNSQNTTKLRAFVVVIIPLIIILAVLFAYEFSVLPSASSISSFCIPNSGYYCSNLTYSNSTNKINFIFDQSTGYQFKSWAIAYAPYNATLSNTGLPDVEFIKVSNAPLNSGQIIQVSIPASSASHVNTGVQAQGNIWICYSLNSTITPGIGNCTASSGAPHYVKVATLLVSAK